MQQLVKYVLRPLSSTSTLCKRKSHPNNDFVSIGKRLTPASDGVFSNSAEKRPEAIELIFQALGFYPGDEFSLRVELYRVVIEFFLSESAERSNEDNDYQERSHRFDPSGKKISSVARKCHRAEIRS
jgi:hypothetical protein